MSNPNPSIINQTALFINKAMQIRFSHLSSCLRLLLSMLLLYQSLHVTSNVGCVPYNYVLVQVLLFIPFVLVHCFWGQVIFGCFVLVSTLLHCALFYLTP